MEKAKRLADEGVKTLLTCFNRPLADWMCQVLPASDSLTIMNFHELGIHLVREATGECTIPHNDGQRQLFFQRELPTAMVDALAKRPDLRFDAIVVDEAQDFEDEWWLLIEMMQGDRENRTLYAFMDDNQRIYQRRSQMPADLTQVPLQKNLRNTQKVFAVAQRFYSGEPTIAAGPTGRAVEYVCLEDPKTLVGELGRCLHRLIVNEHVPAKDVVILSGRSLASGASRPSSLRDVAKAGRFALRHGLDADGGDQHVLLESIYRFKGLERPVVILVELEDDRRASQQLLYVGITRAQAHLVVMGSSEFLCRVQGADESVEPAQQVQESR